MLAFSGKATQRQGRNERYITTLREMSEMEGKMKDGFGGEDGDEEEEEEMRMMRIPSKSLMSFYSY
jgi:hypothetical protein